MDTALYAEAEQVQQAGREYVLAVSSVLSLLLLVLGAGVSFGLVEGRDPVLITLPFLLAGLLVYMLQLITEYRARLGIRRAIEAHFLSGPVEQRIISGTVLADVVGSNRRSVFGSGVLFLIATVAVYFLAIAAAKQFFFHTESRHDWYWPPLGWLYYLFLVLSLVPLVLAAIEADDAEESGFEKTQSRLKPIAAASLDTA